jgi:TP901 family phage tail tape measure protein
MTYDLKLVADVSGVQGVKDLAAAVKALSGELPDLAKKLDALNKVSGKSASGMSQAFEKEGIAKSIMDSNAAVATALAELNTTLAKGYKNAGDTADKEAQKAADRIRKSKAKFRAAALKDIEFTSAGELKQIQDVLKAREMLATQLYKVDDLKAKFGNIAFGMASSKTESVDLRQRIQLLMEETRQRQLLKKANEEQIKLLEREMALKAQHSPKQDSHVAVYADEQKRLAQLKQVTAAVDTETQAYQAAAYQSLEYSRILKSQISTVEAAIAAHKAMARGMTETEAASKYGSAAVGTAKSSSFGELVSNHERLNSQLKAGTQHSYAFGESMKALHSAARGAASGFNAMFLTWGQVAPLMAGAAMTHAITNTVRLGAEVDHSLTTIAELSDESSQSIDQLRAKLISLGDGAYGPAEIASAMKNLSLAGLDAKGVSSSIDAVMNLATAGTTSLETASTTLVSVGTAFGYTASEYSQVGDVIAKTAAITQSSTESMAAAFKYATAIAEGYGVGLTDVAISLGALAQRGIAGTSGGTSTRQFFQEMTGTTSKVSKLLQQLKVDGKAFDAFDASGKHLKPTIQLIHELSTALEKASSKGKTKAISDIFNERANKAAFALMSDYKKSVDAIGQGEVNRVMEVFKTEGITRLREELAKLADQGKITERDMLGMYSAILNKSAGFTAIKSAGMMMSADNQMKSVGSSLNMAFIKAFQEVEPSVIVVSRELRAIFSSDEFAQRVQNLALAGAQLVKFLVANADALTVAIKLWLTYKVTITALGMLSGVTTNLYRMELAVRAGAVAAGAASTPLVLAAHSIQSVESAAARATSPMLTFGNTFPKVAAAVATGLSFLVKAGGWLTMFASAAATAYSAYQLFFSDRKSADTSRAAAESVSEYTDRLKDQYERLQNVIKARKENLNLDVLEARREMTKQEASAKTAYDAEAGPLQAKQTALLSQIRKVYGDKAADSLAGAGGSFQTMWDAAKSVGRANYSNMSIGQDMAKEYLDRATQIAGVYKKTYGKAEEAKDYIKKIEAISAPEDKPKPLGTPGLDNVFGEGGAGPGGESKKLAAIKASYEARKELLTEEANHRIAVQEAMHKAGIQSEALTAAETAAINSKLASDLYSEFLAYKNKYASQISVERGAIAGLDKKKQPAAYAALDAHVQATAAEDAKMTQRVGFQRELAQYTADTYSSPILDKIDKFNRQMQEEADLRAENAALVVKEIGLTDEQKSDLKIKTDLQKKYNKQLAELDDVIVEVSSDLVKFDSESFVGPRMQEDVEAASNLRIELERLYKARKALIGGRDAVLDLKKLSPEEKAKARLAGLQATFSDNFESAGREGFQAWLADGENATRAFGDRFGKTIRKSLGDALWNAWFQQPLEQFSQWLAKGMFGSGTPFEAAYNSLFGMFGITAGVGGGMGGATAVGVESLPVATAAARGAITPFARGNPFTNSVVNKPTYAPTALFGEAGPEAIMPLSRDNRGVLGVRVNGGSSSPASVTHVYNTYQIGGEVTRADLVNLAGAIQTSTTQSITDSLRRGERRFTR